MAAKKVTIIKTIYEWKSKMATANLYWKIWNIQINKLHMFSNILGVKESKKYVILVIRGQSHHLRSPEGQRPLRLGKFEIQSSKGAYLKKMYIN